jgi:hypothetical protein
MVFSAEPAGAEVTVVVVGPDVAACGEVPEEHPVMVSAIHIAVPAARDVAPIAVA